MGIETITRCWPELVGIALCILTLNLLLRANGVRLKLGHLGKLHGDQVGGVQSLSFVLTVPLFIFVMMFIVQLSQLTIAKVVVEYSAFAAARSASVWIPASTEMIEEGPNRISSRTLVETENPSGSDEYYLDDDRRMDVAANSTWGSQAVYVYDIAPGSPKYEKIWLAAAMACVPISPSRDLEDIGGDSSTASDAEMASQAALRAYEAYDPTAVDNPRIPARLRNKIRYAMANTDLEIQVRHKDSEVPLWLLRTPWNDGWYYNELGWQDQITVTVTHHFALLPGPGRLLARRADARPGWEVDESYSDGSGRDSIARQIGTRGRTYTYSITSTARLVNEGHIPTKRYVQSLQ